MPQILQDQLIEAKKNYVLSVRWLKETIGYKNLVSGLEWQDDDNRALVEDADKAFEEAKHDVFYWRRCWETLKKKLLRGNKNGPGK
jgi:hypothetical protein